MPVLTFSNFVIDIRDSILVWFYRGKIWTPPKEHITQPHPLRHLPILLAKKGSDFLGPSWGQSCIIIGENRSSGFDFSGNLHLLACNFKSYLIKSLVKSKMLSQPVLFLGKVRARRLINTYLDPVITPDPGRAKVFQD